jgi:hypothetical protein
VVEGLIQCKKCVHKYVIGGGGIKQRDGGGEFKYGTFDTLLKPL